LVDRLFGSFGNEPEIAEQCGAAKTSARASAVSTTLPLFCFVWSFVTGATGGGARPWAAMTT
jgi:hypothetical protein